MDRLLKIGFIAVGHWDLSGNEIEFKLKAYENYNNLLYTFISNGTIKYIGKTIQTLKKRMYGYQNPGPTQTTNIRVNELVKNTIKKGNPVDIFILPDNGLLNYGSFRINLAAGLEDTLIYTINPEWNYSGKNKLKE